MTTEKYKMLFLAGIAIFINGVEKRKNYKEACMGLACVMASLNELSELSEGSEGSMSMDTLKFDESMRN